MKLLRPSYSLRIPGWEPGTCNSLIAHNHLWDHPINKYNMFHPPSHRMNRSSPAQSKHNSKQTTYHHNHTRRPTMPIIPPTLSGLETTHFLTYWLYDFPLQKNNLI